MSPEETAVLESLRELRPEADYEAANDLVAEGLIDSFDIVSLVSDLEDRFNVKIDGVEIVPENFQSVATIATLVRRSEPRS
jgi:acyl carrier protein